MELEVEEGEVSENEVSEDEDYSPGSLVIDHIEQGSSSGLTTPPPIEKLQATLAFDSAHPIFGMDAPQQSTSSPSLSLGMSATPPPPHSNNLQQQLLQQAPPTSSTGGVVATPLAPIQELFPSLPPLLPFPKAEGQEERLRFLVQTDVPSDGSPPVDTLCIYQFSCGPEYIDIISRKDLSPLIPIKNVYLKAIPGLKQNVLSARISKLGIRSLVLSEPYVSTVKKLNIGLTGSSHYITVSDFIKICNYFRKPIESFVPKLDLIMSSQSPTEILCMFNDPDARASGDLLSRLTKEVAGTRRAVGGDRKSVV